MFKNIFIFVIIFSMSTYITNAYLSENTKKSLDIKINSLISKIESKYSVDTQKDILVKLNKKLLDLQLANKNNQDKVDLLVYLQNNIKKELYKMLIKDKTCPLYYIHKDIEASTFWAWEEADASNGYISNVPSAWDKDWYNNFKKWTENSFYIALPYNDLDANWDRRKDAVNIPWYNSNIKNNESLVKNKWVKVEYNWKIAYGQWEDVWPFHEDDFSYVFWTNKPKNKTLLNAWIDLSPDLSKFIWFDWSWKVNWNFVSDDCVPTWDWTKIITKSNINW